MGALDDPRGQEVDDLAFEAERLERRGGLEAARALYAKAAAVEEALARATAPDAPRVRGLLAVNAVSLWMRAAAHEQAEALADEFIHDPAVPAPARAELVALVEEVRERARATSPCRGDRARGAVALIARPGRSARVRRLRR